MRLHLTRSLALLAIGVGVLTLLWVRSGTAEDVDHNQEIRNRLAKWKQHPDADRLFKGVQLGSLTTPATTTTTPAATTPAATTSGQFAAGTGRGFALCIGLNQVDN